MKMLRLLLLSGRPVSVALRAIRGAAIVFRWNIWACGIATALLLGAMTAHAAIPPLPPLPEPFPETLPTDQFAVEVPAAVAVQVPDEDTAWLTPASTTATPAPVATPDATPALEGPPTPLPPVERMSRGSVDSAATSIDDGKPISLNLKNADLGAVLQTFAKFSGVNIVASEKIRGHRLAESRRCAVAARVRHAARRPRPRDGAPRRRDLGRAAQRTGSARAPSLRSACASSRSRAARQPYVRSALSACRRRPQAPDRLGQPAGVIEAGFRHGRCRAPTCCS